MPIELNFEAPSETLGRPRVLLLGRTDRPMVFVCSPFAGSVQENIQNARRYRIVFFALKRKSHKKIKNCDIAQTDKTERKRHFLR
jgi:hypothetical protein